MTTLSPREMLPATSRSTATSLTKEKRATLASLCCLPAGTSDTGLYTGEVVGPIAERGRSEMASIVFFPLRSPVSSWPEHRFADVVNVCARLRTSRERLPPSLRVKLLNPSPYVYSGAANDRPVFCAFLP